MFGLIRWLSSWVARHLLLFILIVVAMAAFVQVRAAFQRVPALNASLAALEEQQRLAAANVAALRAQAETTRENIQAAEQAVLRRRLGELEVALAAPANQRQSRARFYAEVMTEGPVDAIARDVAAGFRLQLMQREAAAIRARLAMFEGRQAALTADGMVRGLDARIATLRGEIAAIEARHPVLIGVPVVRRFVGGREWQEKRRELAALERQRAAALAARQAALRSFTAARQGYLAARAVMAEAPDLAALERRSAGVREELSRDWAARAWAAVRPVLAWALWVLLLVILAPPATRAFWYFIVAPFAARLAPVRVLPEAGGAANWATGRVAEEPASGTAVSRRIRLRPGEELLVKHEYLHSAVAEAKIDTRLLLDPAMPLSSLATGLVNLTRVRADREKVLAIASTRDVLDEVGLIEVAAGAALVFLPRNLIGIVRAAEAPPPIAKVWRLGHAAAWLTLRLRHIVFHGPCTLIVRGARGVALDAAEGGRRIPGDATLGWSANLAVTVSRNAPFHAYLTGKQSLFTDGFEGQGVVIAEQLPRTRRGRAWWGRGLEGLGDGLMKVVGL